MQCYHYLPFGGWRVGVGGGACAQRTPEARRSHVGHHAVPAHTPLSDFLKRPLVNKLTSFTNGQTGPNLMTLKLASKHSQRTNKRHAQSGGEKARTY